jgi:hypothetical protein
VQRRGQRRRDGGGAETWSREGRRDDGGAETWSREGEERWWWCRDVVREGKQWWCRDAVKGKRGGGSAKALSCKVMHSKNVHTDCFGCHALAGPKKKCVP